MAYSRPVWSSTLRIWAPFCAGRSNHSGSCYGNAGKMSMTLLIILIMQLSYKYKLSLFVIDFLQVKRYCSFKSPGLRDLGLSKQDFLVFFTDLKVINLVSLLCLQVHFAGFHPDWSRIVSNQSVDFFAGFVLSGFLGHPNLQVDVVPYMAHGFGYIYALAFLLFCLLLSFLFLSLHGLFGLLLDDSIAFNFMIVPGCLIFKFRFGFNWFLLILF